MKKAQIQLGESVAVIVIVIIMLVIGITFWSKVSNSDIEEVNTQANELSVIEIANSVSEMSEFKCYDSNVNKVKCVDYYKVKSMGDLTQQRGDVYQYYSNYFQNSKITIQILYPHAENITLYDANLSNSTKSLLIPVPVNVKNYISRQTYYGLIVVEGYYR
ncbi:MAG TPA: hypothetical protein VEC16_02755 [Alphaproteobacteria bacterium]|nr:hypothetical protein [Alphaproteobacteria bacterium]